MSHARILAATALVLGFNGSAVSALTADEVWQDWTEYLAGIGYSVSGDTGRSGDTLTVSDLSLEMELPDAEGDVSMRVGDLELVENDDDSVSVVLPETLPIALAATDDAGERVTAAVEITQDALDLTVSGSADAMRYAYSADALTLALTELEAGEDTPDIRAAHIRLEDMEGTSQSEPGDSHRAVTQKLRAGPVTYKLDLADGADGATMAVDGEMAQVDVTGDASIPESFDSEDVAAALREGFRFESAVDYQDGNSTYRFEDDGQVLEGSNSSARGHLDMSMGPDGLSYGGAGEDVAISAESSDMPFPVNLEMARMAFDIAMPVIETEAMQDYGLDLELAEFTMSDQLWSMIDPGAKLPRDPATLRVDLSGTGRLFFDLLDPEEVEDLEDRDSMPGEVKSLKLDTLTLDVAGARLTGEGDFTFDSEDTQSFGGAPAPEGTLNLRLLGGNALLDKLVSMGLVPEEQASGARMMMGIFAKPGEAEDELVSTIEVTEDGSVLANGQRLK